MGSLPPRDNLHPQIYIAVKEQLSERGDRAQPTPYSSFVVQSVVVNLGLEVWAVEPGCRIVSGLLPEVSVIVLQLLGGLPGILPPTSAQLC